MKNNAIPLIIVLSLLGLCSFGGIVGLGMLAAFFAAQMQPGGPPMATVPVVVAAVDLPADTVLDQPEKQLLLKPFLAETAPPGAFSNLEALRGKVIRRAIDRGAPVLSRDATTPTVQLEPGMRAFSIRTMLAGGFITPGSRVDVLGTVAEPNDGGKSPTKVVAQNVLVLAVDVERQNAGKTVLVSVAIPADAVAAVTQAEKLGPLQVVLRQPKAAEPPE